MQFIETEVFEFQCPWPHPWQVEWELL